MNEFRIEKIEDSPFSLQTVFGFTKEVYADRNKEGIDFWISTCSFEEYKNRVKKDGKTIFVAYHWPDNELLGTAALTIRKDKKGKKYGGMTGCAVKRDCQHQSIGTKLVDNLKQTAKEEKCLYLKSTTAVDAISSVRWHLKNGFLKCGLASGSTSSYYSYVFIMPLINPNSFYYRFGYKIAFVFSYIKTRCTIKENGDLTWFGRFLKKTIGK